MPPTPSQRRRYRAAPASTRRWGRGRRTDGGGANHWTPYNSTSNKGGRADGRDLTAELTAQGYRYVTTKDDLAGVNSGKVLGLFSAKSHLDYELDRVAKGAANTQPSLSEMTAKAIDLLSQNSQGYFLMVEGAGSTTPCTAPMPSARSPMRWHWTTRSRRRSARWI